MAFASIMPKATTREDGVIVIEGIGWKDRVAQWAAMKMQDPDLTNREIADKLGIKVHTLNTHITRAYREKLIRLDDPLQRIEHEIKPKIIDNIADFIDSKDRKMTIEAAKGLGIFKHYQSVETDGTASQTVLALKIEMAPILGDAKTVTGYIVGKPKELKE